MPAFIDLHSHILPGLDEGAKNVEESCAMGKIFSSAGFGTVVGTPHVLTGLYDNSPQGIQEGAARLSEAFDREGISLKILPGAEYYWDFEFYKRLESDRLQTINGNGKYVLVEFPFVGIPKGVEEVSFRLGIKGIKPLLAHPERNGDVIKDFRKALLLGKWGFILQVDLLSLTGFHGSDVRKAAELLIKSGAVHAAAADCHAPPQCRDAVTLGIRSLKAVAGEDGVEQLLHSYPLAIIEGRPLQ